MGAFSEYSKLFKNGIVDAAKNLNYSDSNICILESTIDVLQERFPEVYANLISCTHNRDMRTPLEYGRDLVASWIFEDALIKGLSVAGINISHAGADRSREILNNTKVSASSDSKIEINGRTRLMEIMSDYTGWWSRNGWCDLRDSKYLRLVNSNSLFLGVSTRDKKCFLLDFSKPLNYKYISSHLPYGGKPAYSIKVPPMMSFNMEQVSSSILELFAM